MSIRIASIFNGKARLWLNGRENLFANILKQVNPQEKIAWFHCASLGEFEQGRPVIEAFRKQNPEYKILLTFFSPSGYEIRKNYDGADYIFYLPMDSKRNAEKFIELINPSIVVFIKYELWYHFIQTLNNKNIPVYLISANFRSTQIFFKRDKGNFNYPSGKIKENELKCCKEKLNILGLYSKILTNEFIGKNTIININTSS